MIELFEGDFLDVLPQVVQPHSVQLVVTDLPYGITDKRSQWNNNLVDLPKFWDCMREILRGGGSGGDDFGHAVYDRPNKQ